MFWIIGVSRFCRSFLSHSTEKSRRGILVFLKSYGIEKLLDNKVSRFCRLFFPHSAEKFVENPPMIQKIRAPRKTMQKREVQRFSVDNFSLTVPKNFVGERFCLSEKFQYGKSSWISRGCHVYPSMFFGPKLPKNVVGDTSVFQKCSGIKIFSIIGVSQFFEFFCLTSPKIIVGEPVCDSELFWFPNFLDNMGITILSTLFVSQYRKNS